MSKFSNCILSQLSTVTAICLPSHDYNNYLYVKQYVKTIQATKTVKEIFDLVYKGRVDDIHFLVKKGEVNPNIRNDKDNPLLHHALYYNQFEIAKILVHYGANLNSKDAMGRSPEDIINEKNYTMDLTGLKNLSETLNSEKLNETTQGFVQQNENQEETEINIVGCNHAECIIF